MAKKKLEDVSLDTLRKSKKFGVVLLCVLISAATLSIIIVLRDFIGEKQLDTTLLISASPCLVCALPIYLGIKKVNGEISRRKSQ